jgi:Skp family chaperone for outer membrane proteins
MSATKTQHAVTTKAAEAERAKAENDARIIDHVSQALDAAQDDLASIGSTLGAGARDLGKDVQRLLQEARRDVKKMRGALQGDLQQLQRDLTRAQDAEKPSGADQPT